MTIDNIKSILAELTAPFLAEGRNVVADFEIKDGHGHVGFTLYLIEHRGDGAKMLFFRSDVPEADLPAVFDSARQYVASRHAEVQNMAAVLGIDWKLAS